MGLCGNAVFCRLVEELAKENQEDITILLFEKNPRYLATGFAYSVDSPDCWTLNNPAEGFKFISTADSLTKWMDENQEMLKDSFPRADKAYVPRALVGHYLKAQYEQQKNLAQQLGINVAVLSENIMDVKPLDFDRYRLQSGSNTYDVDALFLTTGHLNAQHYSALEDKQEYVPFEEIRQLSHVDSLGSDIYIIGGQAAFVDAALWLTIEKKFTGTLHSITRNPSVITTKGNGDTCETNALDTLTQSLTEKPKRTMGVDEARNIFWNAYQKDAKEPLVREKLPGTQSALRYQMDKYDCKPVNNTAGNIDELRNFIKNFYFSRAYQLMWECLNEEGKVEFSKQFYSFFMAYLTGITPINARILLALYESSRVIENQGLTDIVYDEEKQQFKLSFASGQIHYTTHIIDATGYRYHPEAQNAKPMLLDRMCQSGLIQDKALGGLELNDNYQIIDSKGRVRKTLFCMGPVANYNNPTPTPHSSFMVSRDVEVIIPALMKNLNAATEAIAAIDL